MAHREHEDGTLKAEQPPQPAENELTASVQAFLAADDDRDRNLLLRAFSAQSAVDWPKLDAFLDAQETA